MADERNEPGLEEAALPLVSVVMPVYNGARFLAEAIESVLEQTYAPIELLVVDDGSTDDSAAIARSVEGVRVIERTHEGPGAARNAGIAAARGEFVAFLDADDVMPNDKLELQVGYLLGRPEVGCVLGRQELLAEDGRAVPPAFAPPISPERHPDLVERGSLQPLSLVARRSVLETVGEFSSEFGEDLDWLARVWGAGIRVDVLDAVVVRRRVHDANLTHAGEASRLAMFQALRSHARRVRERETAADAPSDRKHE